MNRIYRSVWNEITRTFVAAAETVRGRGKPASGCSDGTPVSRATARLTRRRPLPLALEQRFMFDGAAVAPVADAAAAAAAAEAHAAIAAAVANTPAAVEVRAAEPAKDGGKNEVVFVDTSVKDYKSLEAGIRDGVAIVEIDGSKDGLAQIAKWAQAHGGYDSISILGHGSQATLNLGTTTLTDASLANATVRSELATVGGALTSDGDLMLYGCDVAAGTSGVAFIADVALATGADVAASDDATGAASKGGDWVLEKTSGTVEAASLSAHDYSGLLETPVTYSETELASMDGVFNKEVSSATFTFRGAGNYSERNSYGHLVFPDSTNANATKLTIEVNSGYTFDLAGFHYSTNTDDVTITLTLTYADNRTVTGTLKALRGSDMAVDGFSDFIWYGSNVGLPDSAQDVIRVEIASSSATLATADFGTNKYAISDVKGPLLVAGTPVNGTSVADTPAADSFGNLTGKLSASRSRSGETVPETTGVAYGIDGGTLGNYSVGGSDYDVFRVGGYGDLYVNSSTGAYVYVPKTAKIEAYSTETSGVAVSRAEYHDQFDVTAKNSDSTGLTAKNQLLFTIIGQNDTPEVTSGDSATVAENASGTVVYQAKGSDRDNNQTLSYRLTGDDAALFEIDGDGNVRFKVAPDYEVPTDKNGDNVYDIAVIASDNAAIASGSAPNNDSAPKAVKITVTDANEAPSITSAATAHVAENSSGTIYQAAASDPDSGQTIRWSLSGADAALFDIDSSTGAVSFKAAPDREAPRDTGGDNVYNIVVTATDSANDALSNSQDVAITVDNVYEAPTSISISNAAVSVFDGANATVGTLLATDADQGDTFTYTLVSVNGSTVDTSFSVDAGGTLHATASTLAAGTYTLVVRASDDGGLSFDQTLSIKVDDALVVNTERNDAYVSGNSYAQAAAGGLSFAEAIGFARANASVTTIRFADNIKSLTSLPDLGVDRTLTLDFGSTNVTLTGGSLMTAQNTTLIVKVDAGGAVVMDSEIAGSGAFEKQGEGSLTLSKVSCSGATTISAGELIASGNDVFTTVGSGRVVIGSGAKLTLNGNETLAALSGDGALALGGTSTLTVSFDNTSTFAGTISGSGSLVKSGDGMLTLAGHNDYTGTTTLNGGWLSVAGDANLGGGTLIFNGGMLALSAAGNIDNAIALNGAATISTGEALSLSGVISGSGSLTKSGSGTLTLAGSNTYSGTTTVSQGTLAIDGNGQLGGGTLTLKNGATLAVNTTTATAINGITIDRDSTIEVASGAAATLSGTISGSGLTLTKSGAGTLTLTGSIDVQVGKLAVIAGTLATGGDYDLGSLGVDVASGATFALGGSAALGALSGGGSVALGSDMFTTLAVGCNNSSTMFSGVISGSGDFSKFGSGTLTLTGSNTYTGATKVSSGKLALAGNSAIADSSSVSVISGATLIVNASETIGALTGGGSVSLVGSALTIGGASGPATFSGTISGSGSLVKIGSFGQTFSGHNTYSGTTTVSGGTLMLSGDGTLGSGGINLAAGTLEFGDTTTLTNTVTLAGSATIKSDSGVTLTLAGAVGGAGDLVKSGAGTLVLSGVNSYAGTTTVSGGTLAIGSSTNLGKGAISLAGGTTLAASDVATISQAIALTGSATIDCASALVLSGVVSGDGCLVKTGSGMLTLSGSNSYAGTTTVSTGYLEVANDAGLGIGSVSLAAGTTFAVGEATTIDNAIELTGSGSVTISNSAALTLSGTISGTGALYTESLATLTLAGTNTYSGGTTVYFATLAIAGDASLGSGKLTLQNNATLAVSGTTTIDNEITLDNNASIDVGGETTLTGKINAYAYTLTKTGAGTLIFGGSDERIGTTVVAGGTLWVNTALTGAVSAQSGTTVGGNGSISETLTIAAGATLAPGGSNGVGALTVKNTLTLDGTLAVEIASDSSYDQIVAQWNVVLGEHSAITVNRVGGYTPSGAPSYRLIDNSGTTGGELKGLVQGGLLTSGDDDYTVSYSASGTSGSTSLALTSLPRTRVAVVWSSDTMLHKIGDVITISVAFDHAVNVSGTPTLLLETGAIDRAATYSGGNSSTTLTFSYTVQAGDMSSPSGLDYASTSALTLNGGTIVDALTGRPATLTLATPGGGNSMTASPPPCVDGIVPASPGTLSLVAASDSGFSSSDRVTNVTTPTITGTAEAYARVTLYDGSTVRGSATADDSGHWSFTTSALATGVHTLTATATDAAGNESPASAPLLVVIDHSAPLFSPAGGSASYTEKAPAIAVDPSATVDEFGTPSSSVLTVQITAGNEATDALTIPTASGSGIWLDTNGNRIMSGAEQIATASAASVSNGALWTITFAATASADDIQDLVRAIHYSSSSSDPATAERTVSFNLTDGAGNAMTTATRSIAINAVNDAPTNIRIDRAEVSTYDSGSTVVGSLSVTDADSSAWVYTIASMTLPGGTVITDAATIASYFTVGTASSAATTNLIAQSPSSMTAGTYHVTIQVDDGSAEHATYSKNLDITVSDALIVTTANDDAYGGSTYAAEVADGGGLSLAEAIGLANANGGGRIKFADGLNSLSLASATSVSSDIVFDLGSANGTTIGGNFVVDAGKVLTVRNDGGGSVTLSGVISGAGALAKQGSGRLTLAGANTYSGLTTVEAGTLATSGANQLADSSNVEVGSGATLALGGNETVGTLSGAGTVALGANTLTVNESNAKSA